MPPEPPVTRAIRPERSIFFIVVSYRGLKNRANSGGTGDFIDSDRQFFPHTFAPLYGKIFLPVPKRGQEGL
jgi:hypothetical protein